MKKKLLIIDTSVYCVWLGVFDKCDGYDENGKELTADYVKERLIDYEQDGYQFVLPMAVVIETGNHIAQKVEREDLRKIIAKKFVEHINDSLNVKSPWFTFNKDLFENDKMQEMLAIWENKIGQKQENSKGTSLGDVAISQVKHYYKEQKFEVEIFTGDIGLRYFEYKPIKIETEKELSTPLLRRTKK